MAIPLQISFDDLDHSPAVEAAIREKAAALERFHDRIVRVRVVVKTRGRHNHKGKLYDVRVAIATPGKDIVVDRAGPKTHAHEDVYVAIRDAFAAAVRQLEDHARLLRREVKTHAVPAHGVVARLADDHGFIEASDGQEIYFHKNSVTKKRFADLAAGAKVRFAIAEKEGIAGPQASSVTAIGKHNLSD
jgi:cold shock CspA family protein/ribosome-associated translation inhibitor RaiA